MTRKLRGWINHEDGKVLLDKDKVATVRRRFNLVREVSPFRVRFREARCPYCSALKD